jgi:hypothetical protein
MNKKFDYTNMKHDLQMQINNHSRLQLDDVEEHNQYVVLDLIFQSDDYPIHRYEFLKPKIKFFITRQANVPSSSLACSSSNFVSADINCVSDDGVGVAELLQTKIL